jgi:hypothetical protein
MKFPLAIEDAATDADRLDLRGRAPESWCCVDCGVNTAPGFFNRVDLERELAIAKAIGKRGVEQRVGADSEVYTVRAAVWERAGMETYGGCLCVGCLEKRLGRRLKPKDFERDNPFNRLPGSARLMKRMGRL